MFQTVDCYGYGWSGYSSDDFGTLRRGDDLEIFAGGSNHMYVRPGPDGEVGWYGDSGSSCYLRDRRDNLVVTGVQSGSQHDSSTGEVLYSIHSPIPTVRSWIEASQTFSDPRVASRPIRTSSISRDRFCVDRGYGYASSYTSTTASGSTSVARWNGSTWLYETVSNASVLKTVVCKRK